MIYFKCGSESTVLSPKDLEAGLHSALDKIGVRKKILVVPPDITRYHSRAGDLTALTYQYYNDELKDVLPALGTHSPMTDQDLNIMYKGVPKGLFRVHNWRKDVVTVGTL